MNVTPKAVVHYHLRQKGLSQAKLARMLGVSVAHLNTTLAAPLVRSEGHWPAILSALDLELVIRPRQENIGKGKAEKPRG